MDALQGFPPTTQTPHPAGRYFRSADLRDALRGYSPPNYLTNRLPLRGALSQPASPEKGKASVWAAQRPGVDVLARRRRYLRAPRWRFLTRVWRCFLGLRFGLVMRNVPLPMYSAL